MKTFTNTGNITSFDIVHLAGSKDNYLVDENNGKLIYFKQDRKYIVDNVQNIRFSKNNKDMKTIFKWSTEFTYFNIKRSCKNILDLGDSVGNGVYTIRPSDTEIQVYCDMTTDGGGWTLVSYAGTIDTNKETTTGKTNGFYQPLLFNWGTYDIDALNNKNSFSRFDLLKKNAKGTDEFMARRTGNQNNILIFPVINVEWFGRDESEGHFELNPENTTLPYLKLSNTGDNGLKQVTNNTTWTYFNGTSLSSEYPGISWNVTEGENCDNCGRSYETALNRRSLLYWQSTDSGYGATQWFHASPLTLTDSTQASNLTQDIEIWYREV